MKRILIATAGALVTGAPFALAAGDQLPLPDPFTEKCDVVRMNYAPKPGTYLDATQQVALDKALSDCRQHQHKFGNAERPVQHVGTPSRPLLFMPARSS